MVQTLLADGANPALGKSIRVRRVRWGEHHLDALGYEHGLKGWAELGIPIMDQVANGDRASLPIPHDLACLLGDPRGGRLARAAGEIHATRVQLDEK